MIAVLSVLTAGSALADDKKAVRKPIVGGNDNIDLTVTLFTEPAEIKDAVGVELDPGIVVIRVTASVRTDDPLRLSPDDFVLISRKNGERSDALPPNQIASTSSLTVRQDMSGRDFAQITNARPITGVGAMKSEKKDNSAMLAALKDKQFPDVETKKTAEGLVYFSMDTKKLKAKDMAVLYKGKGGRVVIDMK